MPAIQCPPIQPELVVHKVNSDSDVAVKCSTSLQIRVDCGRQVAKVFGFFSEFIVLPRVHSSTLSVYCSVQQYYES